MEYYLSKFVKGKKMNPCIVYITASGMEEAGKISTILLNEKLVACVNLIEGVKSMYWWEGKIETSEEVIIIAKSKRALVDEIITKTRELHSYDCPCIVSFPIEKGNPDFLKWLEQETIFKPV
jgi:periplasmic divalent cation tolerance protein